MTIPDVSLTQIFANPVDDLLIGLVVLCVRMFWKTDKVSAKLMLYLLPLLIKYIRRYYKSGYPHEKLSHLDSEISLLKKRLRHDKIEMVG